MAKINDVSYNSGFQVFNFRDEEGELLTSFKINPSDIGLMARCEEVQGFFEKEKAFLEDASTPQQMLEVNNAIQNKIDYLLGTEADTVFKKPLTATTIMPDGRLFAEMLMETVLNAVEPEIKKRAENQKKRLDKYTSKYN